MMLKMKNKDKKCIGGDKISLFGIFHVHSNFSHDGKSSLDEIVETCIKKELDFCVLTDHYEDFNKVSFNEYLREIGRINSRKDFFLIPGIEISFGDIHIITFPLEDYPNIKNERVTNYLHEQSFFMVIAHPSKNDFEKLGKIIKYVDGFELWNQKADGSYFPALKFVRNVKRNNIFLKKIKFFGLDLHDIKDPINNVIEVNITNSNAEMGSIIDSLKKGNFNNINLKTNLSIKGNDINFSWLEDILISNYMRGLLIRLLRNTMKIFYIPLGKYKFKSVENAKNFVKRYL